MSTNASDIINAAYAAAEPNELDPDKRYAIVVPGSHNEPGGVEVLEPQPDAERANPRRKAGTGVVFDVDSLREQWIKHHEPDVSEVFADPEAFTITAVYNADAAFGAAPGFRDHRTVLRCVLTNTWRQWAAIDGNLLDQMTFAEFIEMHANEVVEPTSAEMLSIAATFEAKTNVDFKAAAITASGSRSLRYEETIAAKAGENGEIEIPHEVTLALQPFEGGDTFRVKARFRYRIRNGNLQLGVQIDRPDVVLRTAFDDVRQKASEACGTTILTGSAPDARR